MKIILSTTLAFLVIIFLLGVLVWSGYDSGYSSGYCKAINAEKISDQYCNQNGSVVKVVP